LGDNDRRVHGWFQPDWDYPALSIALLGLTADLAQVDSLLGPNWTDVTPRAADSALAIPEGTVPDVSGLGFPRSITLSSWKIGE
jgi:hypothetical protein